MLSAVGFSPAVLNTTVSCVSAALPLAAIEAPPVEDELSQPRPWLSGGLLQGQVRTPLMPGSQNATIGPPGEPPGPSDVTAMFVGPLNVVSDSWTAVGGASASMRKL